MTLMLQVMAAVTLVALACRAYRSLHMLQLDGYRAERYVRHSWQNMAWRDYGTWIAGYAGAFLIAISGYRTEAGWPAYVLVGAWVAQVVVLTWSTWTGPVKVPFAMTARMTRLLTATALLTFALGALAVLLASSGLSRAGSMSLAVTSYLLAGALVLLEPALVVAAVLLLGPLEARNRRRFVNAARRRLESVRPLVIGVAGSYGKTTTKSALVATLSSKFKVLASPESYNTLLGVTRTINECLTDDVDVFVVEMGARQAGDIAEICDLVHPTVGVVTRLGPQHLEYFGSAAAIIRAKTELLRALPPEGFAVVDADGLTDFRTSDGWAVPVTRVSTQPAVEADVLLSVTSISSAGSVFKAEWRDGTVLESRTPLMGRHAAFDCGLAAVVALKMGVEPRGIADGLQSMQSVPHRLEVVRDDSVVVIDDAYNSNPAGFEAALEVLGSLEGRRILVTPGMIELGSATVGAHERIAALAAAVCDVVILVGRTYPKEFLSVLLDSGLPPGGLRLVSSLAEATEMLGQLVRAGDVVLFENDLPDNFR